MSDDFNLRVSAGDLTKALRAIAPVIERRNTIPVLSCARFELGRVTATDLDIEIETSFAHMSMTGAACIPHGPLLALASNIAPDALVTLASNAERGGIDLTFTDARSGAGDYNLASLPAADWQGMVPDEMPVTWECGNARLADAFKLCRPAISTEPTRYYLNGVCLNSWSGRGDDTAMRPCAVATDGHRLIVVDLPGAPNWSDEPNKNGTDPALIVPRKAVGIICDLGNPTQFDRFGATKIRLRWPGLSVTTKLIDGNFPDFGRVVPQRGAAETQLTLQRGDYKAASARLSAVDSSRSQSRKITLAGGAVRMSAGMSEIGSGTETLEAAHYTGRDLELGLNAKYMSAHFGVMADDVPLSISDAASPVAAFGDGVVSVLMPLRV